MKRHNLFWGSSYDRGLDVLLFLWPDVLEKYPNAKLHITYGWDLFDLATVNNPERKEWKKNVQTLMGLDGIKHYGRVDKETLRKIRGKCGIWAYPTYFTEINCITALECQLDGVVPVVCNLKDGGEYTALNETVGSGIKVDGSIYEKDTKDRFLSALLDIMGDKERWKAESKKGKKFAKKYNWTKIARKWTRDFEEPIDQPLVSIITPTIRDGFWNVMANNISGQTYSNLEWVIVDDFKKDRSKVAAKYSDKWGIKIKYLRGKPNNKRNYGLSSANNIGWKNASGELCVWLQDFVLMDEDCIENLVDLHRKFPEALIAPVDRYYAPRIPPNTDSEDWFGGELGVVGKWMRDNQRILNKGMRFSEDAAEFEMNIGAIPKKVLKQLNGFWEFYDDALGYDNTEIAYRALLLGSRLIVDDKIVVSCIDHWEPLRDKQEQLGKDRIHNLNDPRFQWMLKMMEEGRLPLRRSEELDEKCNLRYEIPKNLDQNESVEWMWDNMESILSKWGKIL